MPIQPMVIGSSGIISYAIAMECNGTIYSYCYIDGAFSFADGEITFEVRSYSHYAGNDEMKWYAIGI